MFGERLERFFFPVCSTIWITLLRTGLGLQILLYGFSLRRDWNYFFASGEGLIDRGLTEAILNLDSRLVPRLGWIVAFAHQLGLSEQSALGLTWFAFLAGGFCLLFGLFSRVAAVGSWLLHLAVRSSGGFFAYGVDHFMTIGLFYLALAPLPDRYSVDCLFLGKRGADLWRVGFQQRLLQLHLCLIYFFGGLSKSLGAGWWNGTSMWRALIRPPFNIVDPALLQHWTFLLPAAGISICILETCYPICIWLKSTRRFWLLAIIVMHAGIALLMGLSLFAMIMIVLNIAAFAPCTFLVRRRSELPSVAEA